MRLTNESDKTIVLEPGQSLDFSGELDHRRVGGARIKTAIIEEIVEKVNNEGMAVSSE